jgi:hypothetical protein
VTDIIDDLVVLGRAVPETLKDGRKTVCLGGLSRTRGFIRIYPTRLKTPIKRWDILRVEVERNNRDSRSESWKIVGSRDEWSTLGGRIRKVGRIDDAFERRDIVLENLSPCVEKINSAHKSLGIVQPTIIHRKYFGDNPQYGRTTQPLLFDVDEEDWAAVKRDFPLEPRLEYTCSNCRIAGNHNQKILEWGFYMWMHKNPDNVEQVWTNARIESNSHETYLFVGNQVRYPTSFLIISVLPIRRLPDPPPWIQSRFI